MAEKRGNNEGTISQRKDGRWEARVTVGVIDGKIQRKCQGYGEWFMADHGKQRHCSDYCKTKAYRRRQQAKKEDNHA